MKMNACRNTIRMWKIAQIEPAMTWPTKPNAVARRAKQSDQQEQQLAGKHVAEQSHAERHGFCCVLDDVQTAG